MQRSQPLSFFDELKRRKVFRVIIAYVVGAWVIAQVADLVAETYLVPVWVMQMIVTLLVVGLPISLILRIGNSISLTSLDVRKPVAAFCWRGRKIG